MRHAWFAFLTLVLLAVPRGAVAHEGHAEAPGEEAAAGASAGVVSVSETARTNLSLVVAEAEIRPIEKTLTVIGDIAPVPGRSGAVSSRIAGRVVSVGAAEGESVRTGQVVVVVESLQVGDPPPRARYVAPLDGVVIDRHVVPGDAVEPNAHLLEIADLSEVLAVGRVFEGQVGRVAVGQAVRVSVPSYPERAFQGSVERIGGQLDPATRSLSIYVRIANPDRLLRPHMRAVLAVVTENAEAALAVPRSAVLGDFGSSFVFVESDADPSRFERRPVVTGLADDRWIEIVDGVLPGDRVVTAGNYSLQFLPPAPAAEHEEPMEADAKGAVGSSPPPRKGVLTLVLASALGIALVVATLLLGMRFRRRSA
jgi:multidrug efflux pump subunit AcrA (membrane-fusion protein)